MGRDPFALTSIKNCCLSAVVIIVMVVVVVSCIGSQAAVGHP